jgi:hypothetical protein
VSLDFKPLKTPALRDAIIAGALSVLWVLGIGGYAAGYYGLFGGDAPAEGGAFNALAFILAAVLPLVLIWFCVMLLAQARALHEDAAELAATVKRVQTTPASTLTARVVPQPENRAFIETRDRMDALSQQIQQVETALVALLHAQMSARDTQVANITAHAGEDETPTHPTKAELDQGSLPLGQPEPAAPAQPPNWGELIHALNFPTDEKDKDGFRALRIAMQHRNTSLCLRASEDIMNLLAQDGVYMDDLQPEPAKAAMWRRFADGERGREMDPVGGIRDVTAVAMARGRMRNDPIFRDAALHFQRRFDIVLREFCREGDDKHVEALANTRSGRAFMLLGRVSGMFG